MQRPTRVSGNYIMDQTGAELVHVIFSMKESVGCLAEALKVFKVCQTLCFPTKIKTNSVVFTYRTTTST